MTEKRDDKQRDVETAAIIKTLVDAYPNQKIEPATVDTYIENLSDIHPEILGQAARHWIQNSKWRPMIAQLRETVEELTAAIEEEDPYPTAWEAWEWVSHWISDSGRGRSGGWDMAERAVARVGGWATLGQGLMDERKFVGLRFREAYADLLDVQDGRDRQKRLTDGIAPETLKLIRGVDA